MTAISGFTQKSGTLAGVAQRIELGPVNQRVAGSILSLGHRPRLQVRSPVGEEGL